MPMSQKIAAELLPRLRQRYANRGREGRTRLIDAVCEQWGYSRKHAIKRLDAQAGWKGDPPRRQVALRPTGRRFSPCCGGSGKPPNRPAGNASKPCYPPGCRTTKPDTDGWKKQLRQKVLSISAAPIARRLAARKVRVSHRGAVGPNPAGF